MTDSIDLNKAQLKNISDGTAANDASTMEESAVVYYNGARYVRPPDEIKPITFASGQAVMYLTKDGTSGGTPIFTTVTNVEIEWNNDALSFGMQWSVSGVALTITATQQTFTGLSLLGDALLGSEAMSAITNGTTATVTVKGIGNAI